MYYSKLYLQKKENVFPLIIVFGFVLFAMIFTIKSDMNKGAKRILQKQLIRYEVVNVTPYQFGIFWMTEKPEKGWVVLNGKVFLDERDVPEFQHVSLNHYVLLKGLNPNTSYSLTIHNENGMYKIAKNNTFTFLTPPVERDRIVSKPTYGRVISPNGKVAQNVLVLFKVPNAYPLLTFTKETGEWLISIGGVMGTNKRILTNINEKTSIELEYIDDANKRSRVFTILRNTTPLTKTVVIGTDYKLLAQNGEVLSVTDENKETHTLPISVVYPRENSLIPGGRPLFKGGGLPGQDIFVFINSKPQFAYRTKADKEGVWLIQPNKPISPGSYTATITTQDVKGTKISLKRNFLIAKSGEQVLGDATTSATITPTIPISPTAHIQPSPTTQTVVPTLIPTIYPTQTQVLTVMPTSAPPTTGGSMNHLILASFAFIVVGIGVMLVF